MNGNFGFYKGFNYAMPFLQSRGIGAQGGINIAFSDFEGSTGFADRSRTQFFVTGGLFRRARCNHGLQGGAVLDYLRDDWYVNMNLLQIRAEASYLWGFHELGFWAAAHTNSNTRTAPASFATPTVTWQANDQYNLYYRANFSYGAWARMWVGLSGHGDVLFGGDAVAPISESYAILISQNYLLPRGNSSLPNSVVESWGLVMSLVWYPGAAPTAAATIRTGRCSTWPTTARCSFARRSEYGIATHVETSAPGGYSSAGGRHSSVSA